jgi:hypothetical protein
MWLQVFLRKKLQKFQEGFLHVMRSHSAVKVTTVRSDTCNTC